MKKIKYILGSILGLAIVSLVVSVWMPIGRAFRIVFGSVYVLFLPGLVLTFAFFRDKEIDPVRDKTPKASDGCHRQPISNGVDVIERITLSFALSIAIVPLLIFYLNLIGMKITALNVSLVIAFIVVVSLAIIWRKKLSTA